MPDSLELGEAPSAPKPDAYRVLARKYRPQTFSELIGQDAMVRTLGNAIKRDRLAHAFLMTGVRGVGKTSTARLIAKALNCIGPDGQGGPTIDPCGICEPCRAIAEGRHIDVIEMDAASHTGVDDVREIIDAARYAAVSARFKIYIVDEVHMLSKNAFNALLKTLEEPPAHVKFLFATTEVNKVPVTVLSRCQRFDLRRIPADRLAEHFATVSRAEGIDADDDALMLIARAAEGSARDGLSILDQAIAHAGVEDGQITAVAVRQMLGLSDRGMSRELFSALLEGDGRKTLAMLRQQYDHGVDPLAVFRALLETVHGVTLVKVGAPVDSTQPEEERAAQVEWSAALSFPVLHRFWQLLLKGHDEVAQAALPIESAEMALLRVVHASTLPDPGELARQILNDRPPSAPVLPQQEAAASAVSTVDVRAPESFAALVEWLDQSGSMALAARLRHGASVVSYTPGDVVFSGSRPMAADILSELSAVLRRSTGRNWRITMADLPGATTLKEDQEVVARDARQAILDSPLVKAAFAAFPDAELIDLPAERSIS